MKKVIVLGAGLSGLAAAWKLSAEGIKVELIEKEGSLGGIASSVRRNGYTFDYGPHRFHTKDDKLLSEMKALVGPGFRELYRKSSIRLKGEYFSYPLEGRDLILKMNPLVSAQAFMDYGLTVLKNRLSPRPDSSFESWVVNRFGRTLYEMYFGPYTAKLWGIAPNKISMHWASQRISLMNLWDVFARLFKNSTDAPRTYISKFYYPEHGISQLAEELGNSIKVYKGAVLLESQVKELIWDNGNIKKIRFQQEGCWKEREADFFISTIPITDLVKASRPILPDRVVAASDRLRYRAIVFLFMVVSRDSISDDHWIYYPEKDFIFNRIYEPKNFSPKLTIPGTTSLCVEISCDQGDVVWEAGQDTIFEKIMRSFKKSHILDRSEVKDYFVGRLSHAYPVYQIGYEQSLGKLLDFAHSTENLITTDRQGLFRYGNMDHAIDMGIKAAECVIAGKDKKRAFEIANEKEYFG